MSASDQPPGIPAPPGSRPASLAQAEALVAGNVDSWQRWAAADAQDGPEEVRLPGSLNWTQIPRVGPGEEILGELAGERLLDLGCGTGDNAAYLATLGAAVIGVDAASANIVRARARWGHLPGVEFRTGEASTFLAGTSEMFDVVVSVFGAIDFVPPKLLLPLLAQRIRPGGQLGISTVHADRDPQVPVDRLMLPGGGRLPVTRPLPSIAQWHTQLQEAGFGVELVEEVRIERETTPRTVVIVARRR